MPTAAIPPRMNMVDVVLTRHLREGRGGRPAIYTAERVWSYAELDELVGRVAARLLEWGLAPADRVVMRMPLSPAAVGVFLGAIRLAACPVPTSVLLREADFGRIIRHSQPRLVVVDRHLAETVAGVLAEVDQVWTVGPDLPAAVADREPVRHNRQVGAEDIAYFLYTSGSTGDPKGVMRAHRVILGSAPPNVEALMGLTEDDVCYQPHQDLSFSYPLGHGLLFPLTAGAAAVIEPARPRGRLDGHLVWQAIERYGVTVFSGVPGVYRHLWETLPQQPATAGRRVRLWITAGEPLPDTLARAWEDHFGQPIYGSLGQSEVPSFVGHLPGRAIKRGSLGLAFPGVPVAVVDDSGRPLPDGTIGNLAIAADYPGLCSGYFRMPERWRAVCHHGWYFTQDLALRDADGYFWHQGRADELIKVRGYSVTPAEVEAALEALPEVARAGVVGVPDPQWGTAIWAFVVANQPTGLSGDWPQRFRDTLRTRLSSYKIPHHFRRVDELPLTDSGKLKRRTLKEWALAEASAAPAEPAPGGEKH